MSGYTLKELEPKVRRLKPEAIGPLHRALVQSKDLESARVLALTLFWILEGWISQDALDRVGSFRWSFSG